MSTSESVDRALEAVLRPGQDVVLGQGYGAPRALVAALGRHRERLRGSRLLIGMLLDELPELPETRITTFFPAGALGNDAELTRRGVAYARESLYALTRSFATGDRAVDVVLATATAGDRGGHSLGLTVDYVRAAAERATDVVLEVSDAIPWTGPRSLVPDGPRVIRVPASEGATILHREPSDRDWALADRVVPWIPDGATLQLGMGPWATAVAARLSGRRDLRVHTGLVSDWAMHLGAAGALAREPIVATGAGGSAEFYGWLDRSPRVGLASALETHDPATLARLPALHAINSVLEVDLLGRANCEVGTGGRRGGIGGLPDFAAAAARADDGLSVLALAATRPGGSRIVARLPDDGVSLTAAQVDVVVTEHGSADLRGLSAAERIAAMLELAAPEYRKGLREEVSALSSTD